MTAAGAICWQQDICWMKPACCFQKSRMRPWKSSCRSCRQTKEKNQAAKPVAKPQKENISYDDFARMDIRIGTILEAVKVPKTKKLMQLKIDTGMDVRTVVSGIAEYFEPEAIIGKQICLLANLEPREIKGITVAGHDPARRGCRRQAGVCNAGGTDGEWGGGEVGSSSGSGSGARATSYEPGAVSR